LSSQAEPDLQAFEATVRGWPEVRECYMLAGETDFLLKVVAADWDAYQDFLTTRLTAAPNVSHVKSALSIRAAKSEPGVPIDVPGDIQGDVSGDESGDSGESDET
jgi:DNA-binding Lrp family transcriptional regulator